jgi:hypothetical protein
MTTVIRTALLPLTVLVAVLCASTHAVSALFGDQTAARTLTESMPASVGNREMQPLIDGPRRGLRLDARMGDGVAWWPDVRFGDGTIELDLRGKDVPQQSFVGVAFHGADEKSFDAVYFRPFNFRATTEVGRSRSVQYVSHPTYTWDRLRAEHPGRYEAAMATPPDPNGWFHARLEIAYPTVRVFVEPIATPVLEVQQLSERKIGWVGVWVGNGSDGAFSNVVIRPPNR